MSELTEEKKVALAWIGSNEKRIISLSNKIYRYAEPALREFKSSRTHAGFLRRYGFRVKVGVAGMPTAFIATWGKGKPIIATYAEYDATPGNSQKPVAYIAPWVPHAPGFEDMHNMLGTSAIAGAIAVRVAMERKHLKGTIKVFGTPAEKILLGKTFLARDGYFDNLDAVVATHPHTSNRVRGIDLPNCYIAVAFRFHGLQVYSANPWLGKSAVDATILMNVMVTYMKEHMPPPHTVNEIISVGGGGLTNIPDFSEVLYSIRTRSEKESKNVLAILKTCADAATKVTGCQHETIFVGASRTGLPNLSLATLAYENMRLIGAPRFSEKEKGFCRRLQKKAGIAPMSEPLDEKIYPPEREQQYDSPYDILTDDSNEFSWYAPFAWIHTTQSFKRVKSDTALRPPSWSRAALTSTGVSYKGGIYAAKIIAFTILDLLTDRARLNEIKTEYHTRLKAHGGMEPILVPRDAKPAIDLALPEFNGKETIIRYPATGMLSTSRVA